MLRWLRNVAFLVTGVIFGPLLLAIVTALCTPSPAGSPAQALFREYDSRHPSIVLNSASPFPAVRECGYDPDALFSREDQAHFAGPGERWHWTPHAGYSMLAVLQMTNLDQRRDAFRIRRLDAVTSDFSARFLRECMRSTMFAPLCERRTRDLLGSARGGPREAPEPTGDFGTICTYLDGVAARRGLPLAKR